MINNRPGLRRNYTNFNQPCKGHSMRQQRFQKNSKYYYHKGMALFELKKFDDSIDCYNKAIKIFPKDSNYYFDKGIVLNEL